MKRVLVWLSLIAAVLPGMAVTLNGFGTPEDLRIPFGIIAIAFGVVAFGATLVAKAAIRRSELLKNLEKVIRPCGEASAQL